jgi:hypothetical protein
MTAKERYARMTREQKEARKAYQRDYMRARRAAQKGATTGAKPPKVQCTAPTVKAAPRSIVKSAQPAVRAQDLASYDDVSAQKARNLQRAWRKEVSEYLLDVMTSEASPISGAGIRSSQMLCLWFGVGEKLNRIVDQDKPAMTEEFLVAVMLECLRRLTGERPTAAPPKIG